MARALRLDAKRRRRRLLQKESGPRLKRADQQGIYLKSAAARRRRAVRLMILRRAVLHAGIGAAALGGFALRKRIVGAFLRRSGLQAEIVMNVLREGRGAGQRRRKHAGNHDETHLNSPFAHSPGSLTRVTRGCSLSWNLVPFNTARQMQ